MLQCSCIVKSQICSSENTGKWWIRRLLTDDWWGWRSIKIFLVFIYQKQNLSEYFSMYFSLREQNMTKFLRLFRGSRHSGPPDTFPLRRCRHSTRHPHHPRPWSPSSYPHRHLHRHHHHRSYQWILFFQARCYLHPYIPGGTSLLCDIYTS